MINQIIPSVVRQIPSLPKTYFVRDIISYGYFGDVTRSRSTVFSEDLNQNLDERDRGRLYDEIVEFFNDAYFNAPVDKQNRLVSVQQDRDPVYFYSNDFRSRDIFGNNLLNRSTASHGSDLLYLFGPEMYRRFLRRSFQSTK